jgi:hypothetical protein
MDALIHSIHAAQQPSSESNEITRTLFEIESTLNSSTFAGLPPENRTSVLRDFWRFFLFSAAHPSSNVRIAAYQATGSFLLKLTPYFASEIHATFGEQSTETTIAIQSSAIIASAFAYISKTISLPLLEEFLDSTPVYHHFSLSDTIFSEHLSSIISNLGPLGIEWFSTLLNSLLLTLNESSNHSMLRAISAIVKHHPAELMTEILDLGKSRGIPGYYLSLVSFILSSQRFPVAAVNFSAFAQRSLAVLSDPGGASITERDSSL